ncbi:hypothetical protein Cni_G10015 [Canna indica]|uniref:Fungal lipase-like domain-containing protein n=1 Tax=Canna indica TaxID=4628 RepID=A0AAQ3K3F8_9LILI|nr:hypothetical protein Cni_G10015 [Canna indica]
MRLAGAPRAILALRGTLLKSPTIRRDLVDDLRFLAWESLKGSARFHGALEALNKMVERFGSTNVCVGGHSLGAGFTLQVGKALAKHGIFVECHIFNPPSVSLAMSIKSVGEKASFLWKRIKESLPSKVEASLDAKDKATVNAEKMFGSETKKWMPHMYVNNRQEALFEHCNGEGSPKLIRRRKRRGESEAVQHSTIRNDTDITDEVDEDYENEISEEQYRAMLMAGLKRSHGNKTRKITGEPLLSTKEETTLREMEYHQDIMEPILMWTMMGIPPTYDKLVTSLDLPSIADIKIDENFLKGPLDLRSFAAMIATDRRFIGRNRGALGEPLPQYESLQARLKALSSSNSN